MIVFELLEKVMSYSGILRLEARRVGTARRVPSLGISIYIYTKRRDLSGKGSVVIPEQCICRERWSRAAPKAKLMPGIIQGLFFVLVEDMSSQTRWVARVH